MEKEKAIDVQTPKDIQEKETPASYPLTYQSPTSGFPIVAIPVSVGGIFKLKGKSAQEAIGITPPIDTADLIPLEPADPKDMDDGQNVLNIVASGCNLATNRICEYDFKTLMTYCEDKLGLLLSNGWIWHGIDDGLAKFLAYVYPPEQEGHKAFVGFNLLDEPTMNNLDGKPDNPDTKEENNTKAYLKHSYYVLAKDILNKQRTDSNWNPLVHVNLYPIHGIDNYTDYQAYLDKYQTLYNPAYYSFDQYPVMQFNPMRCRPAFLSQYSKVRPGAYIQFHERFYRTLQMISDQGRKYGKPFWAYPLTSEHVTGSAYFPAQKEQFLRYQVFTALAYGAKGLCYWRFLQLPDDRDNLTWLPEDKESGWKQESFFRHPIRENRRRSPYWYYVRRINKEIRKYEDIFLTAKLHGVYHTNTGEMMALASRHGIPNGIGHGECKTPGRDSWGLVPLKEDSIPVIKQIVSHAGGLGVTASYFSGPGLNLSSMKVTGTNTGIVSASGYAVIVNHDALNYQKIHIYFQGDRTVDELTPLNSSDSLERTPIDCKHQTFLERNLPPGGYLIFHWSNIAKPTLE